jgi:hypothetical protein
MGFSFTSPNRVLNLLINFKGQTIENNFKNILKGIKCQFALTKLERIRHESGNT